MAFQAIKAIFCGPAACCLRTSPSDSYLDPTYQQFNNDIDNSAEMLTLSPSYGRHERRSHTSPNERVEEIELKDITSSRDMDDDEEMPTWRGEDLCDLHRKSVRRRRKSLSLSNLLDLTEPETNINAFSISPAEKRSTFPPSRRKNENMQEKRINNLRNAAEFYQVVYSRLDPEEYDDQERKSPSTDDTSISSFSTADSSYDWQYNNLNSHRCFEICTDSEMEKSCERKDLVGDSYTLYNVIKCPMCRVTKTGIGKAEDHQLVRLYI